MFEGKKNAIVQIRLCLYVLEGKKCALWICYRYFFHAPYCLRCVITTTYICATFRSINRGFTSKYALVSIAFNFV